MLRVRSFYDRGSRRRATRVISHRCSGRRGSATCSLLYVCDRGSSSSRGGDCGQRRQRGVKCLVRVLSHGTPGGGSRRGQSRGCLCRESRRDPRKCFRPNSYRGVCGGQYRRQYYRYKGCDRSREGHRVASYSVNSRVTNYSTQATSRRSRSRYRVYQGIRRFARGPNSRQRGNVLDRYASRRFFKSKGGYPRIVRLCNRTRAGRSRSRGCEHVIHRPKGSIAPRGDRTKGDSSGSPSVSKYGTTSGSSFLWGFSRALCLMTRIISRSYFSSMGDRYCGGTTIDFFRQLRNGYVCRKCVVSLYRELYFSRYSRFSGGLFYQSSYIGNFLSNFCYL